VSLPEDRLRDVWREEIVPDVFLDARPEARPVAVLLGGQPGAGKTRAARLVTRGLYPGLRVTPIAGDDLRRFHPDYGRTLRGDRLRMPEVTAAAAGWWFQASIEHALAHRFPVLIEGTWRNVAGPLQGAGDARTAGYEVHAVVVAVAPAVSRLSTVERFYRDVGAGHDARWTPPQAHDQAVTALPASTHRLAASRDVDRFTVVDRDGRVLYDGTGWSPERAEEARAALRGEMDRLPGPEQAAAYLAVVEDLGRAHRAHTLDEPQAREVWARIDTCDVPVVRGGLVRGVSFPGSSATAGRSPQSGSRQSSLGRSADRRPGLGLTSFGQGVADEPWRRLPL
jgi:UDP-N-acetylglucosamine kinase